MTENSRWDLPDDDVGRYLARSFDFIMDLLTRMDHAEPFKLDPSGDDALRLAKHVRRQVLRVGRRSSACAKKPTGTSGCRRRSLTFASTLTPAALRRRARAASN